VLQFFLRPRRRSRGRKRERVGEGGAAAGQRGGWAAVKREVSQECATGGGCLHFAARYATAARAPTVVVASSFWDAAGDTQTAGDSLRSACMLRRRHRVVVYKVSKSPPSRCRHARVYDSFRFALVELKRFFRLCVLGTANPETVRHRSYGIRWPP
jgi:hypothetical protein